MFGAVFAEAMLHGLPCVGSRAYGSEVITEGVTGWLVESGDVDGLAAAVLIEALREPRARLRSMGLVGRRKAETADHVFPQIPVRQWVLSLPKRLRYFLRLKASSPGAPADARFGAVTFVHRFGSALNR